MIDFQHNDGGELLALEGVGETIGFCAPNTCFQSATFAGLINHQRIVNQTLNAILSRQRQVGYSGNSFEIQRSHVITKAIVQFYL